MPKQSKGSNDEKMSGRVRRKAAEAEAKKRRLYYIVGGIVAVIVLVAAGYVIRERNKEEPLPAIVAGPPLEISAPVNGHTAGDPDAPIALVEWGDYQ